MWSAETNPKKIITLLACYTVASLLLFLLDHIGSLRFVHTITSAVTLPVNERLVNTSNNFERAFLVVPQSIAASQKVARLEKDNNDLRATLAQFAQVQQENDQLRQELALPQAKDRPKTLAHVYPSGDQTVIRLDQPQDIPIGAAVMRQNTVVGFVDKRYSETVYAIMPTTNAQFKSKIKVMHQATGIDGVAQGASGTQIRISHILANAPVAEGDMVVIDDPEKGTASGFIIGKVHRVIKKEADVFQEAVVDPLFDITQGNIVFVSTQL